MCFLLHCFCIPKTVKLGELTNLQTNVNVETQPIMCFVKLPGETIGFPHFCWNNLPSGYLTVRHGKIHHAIKDGKPSISTRAIEKPWRTVSHNQRVS